MELLSLLALVGSEGDEPPQQLERPVMSQPSDAPLILYVEDEILLHGMLEDALREAGYQVVTASSGSEALDRLQTLAGTLRGLVTDINMPGGIGGWELGRHARGLIPALPIVYVSGGSEHEWTAEGVPHSVMVAKPFAVSQIVVAIAHLINASDAPGSDS